MKQANTWQLQEAKAHFSKVVREAIEHGPQDITLRGKPSVIVISKVDYDKLTKHGSSFVTLMRKSPLVGLELSLKRNKSLTRDIDL
ncbi:MAG: type II toxin-antitoxin system Phd/YefM family antitoxin [Gammaproteobacteria bacterium]